MRKYYISGYQLMNIMANMSLLLYRTVSDQQPLFREQQIIMTRRFQYVEANPRLKLIIEAMLPTMLLAQLSYHHEKYKTKTLDINNMSCPSSQLHIEHTRTLFVAKIAHAYTEGSY